MIRRYGESVRTGQRYTRRPGVYAVLLRGNSVLVTHQAEPVPEFQLPGGGIDAGEHPIAALHREVFEETGWKIEIGQRVGAFRRFTYMPEYDKWAERSAPFTWHDQSIAWARRPSRGTPRFGFRWKRP